MSKADINSNKLNDIVSVRDFGAMGDGVTDDTAAIQAALDSGAKLVYVPGGNYRTTATINMNSTGQALVGASRSATSLLADFRGGAVIQITMGRCRVADLSVSTLAGSARRQASPFANPLPSPPSALVDGNSADRGINLYETVALTNLLTYTKIERVDVAYQPGDGIAMGGAGSGTIIEQCGVTYCGGHGMFFDDGDRDGTAKTRNGIVDIRDCVIQQCWGHGVALSPYTATTVFRFNLHNLDIFSVCLGDGGTNQPAFMNSTKSAIAARAQNLRVTQCGIENLNGIQLSNVEDAIIESTRFVNITNNGLVVNSGCSRVLVINPYFFGTPTLGFRVQGSCDNVRIEGVKSSEYASATAIIDAESETILLVDGKQCRTIAGSNSLWYDDGINSSTVSSGNLNVQSKIVSMIGEGDVTDTISNFRFVSGVAVPEGTSFIVLNKNAYNLNIAAGGNIDVQGTTMILETGEAATFVYSGGTYYAVDRGIP